MCHHINSETGGVIGEIGNGGGGSTPGIDRYEEVVHLTDALPDGKSRFEIPDFVPNPDSLVMVNGMSIPSSDYTITGSTVALEYNLMEGDFFTVIK